MTDSAGADGAAFNATARIGEVQPTLDDPLRRLQLADLDARQVVERIAGKVEKYRAHLTAAEECLADAHEAAATAAADLDAYPETVE